MQKKNEKLNKKIREKPTPNLINKKKNNISNIIIIITINILINIHYMIIIINEIYMM